MRTFPLGISLKAIDRITGPLKTIGASVSNFQNTVSKASGKASKALDFSAKASMASQGIAAVRDKAVGFLEIPIKEGMEFDTVMSGIKARTGLTGSEFNKTSDAAKKFGANTNYTATEAAQAMEFWAIAGKTSRQELTELTGVTLSLATATKTQLGPAADMLSDTLGVWSQNGRTATEVSNVMARTINSSNIPSMEVFFESMKLAGPVARKFGVSLEETSSLLGVMANSGIKGSQAGTALGGALARLASPTKKVSDMLSSLGINITDIKTGKAKKMSVLFGEIANKAKGMSDIKQLAITTALFGREAGRMAGMSSLFDAGASGIEKMTAKVSDATVTTEKLATIMNDNLAGDMAKFNSAISGVKMEIYEAMRNSLRALAVALTPVINWLGKFAKNNPVLTKTIVGIVAAIAILTAVIVPLLLTIGALSTGLAYMKIGFAIVSSGLTVLKAGIISFAKILWGLVASNPILAMIAGLIIAVVLIVTYWDEIKAATVAVFSYIGNFFKSIWDKIVNFFRSGINWVMGLWDSLGESTRNVIKTLLVIFFPFLLIPMLIIENWDLISNFFTTLWNNIYNTVANWISVIVSVITEKFNSITNFFTSIWEIIKTLFFMGIDFLNQLLSPLYEAWGGITNFFSGLWEGIKGIFNSGLNIVSNLVSKMLNILPDWAKSLITGKSSITGLISGEAIAAGSQKKPLPSGRNVLSTENKNVYSVEKSSVDVNINNNTGFNANLKKSSPRGPAMSYNRGKI